MFVYFFLYISGAKVDVINIKNMTVTVERVPPRGSCMFQAVACQIMSFERTEQNFEFYGRILREISVNFMRSNMTPIMEENICCMIDEDFADPQKKVSEYLH